MEEKGEEVGKETRRISWEIEGTKWIVIDDVVGRPGVTIFGDEDCPNQIIYENIHQLKFD